MNKATRLVQRNMPPTIVLLFGLLSVLPLLHTRSICSDDGLFHIHKAVGLEAVIELGHWFPRWSPHMAHGFGYPLYNFYAPLGSYVLAGLHALGFIYPVALHVIFGLCILLSGMAVFALVRNWWGPWAGMAAAVVYETSPYLAFNVLFRGALSETIALFWLPMTLWAIDRALRQESPRWGTIGALCFGALIYTHNTSALLAAPLIVAYAIFLASKLRRPKSPIYAFATIIGGLALSAHFWLPAMIERDLVHTENLLVPPVFTYYTNFLSGDELLATPTPAQPLLLNPSPPKALGTVAATLALVGAASVMLPHARSKTNKVMLGATQQLFFSVSLFIYGSLTLSPTMPLWEAIPLLHFVQFPWRMLGVATLCAAILAGAATTWSAILSRPWLGAAIVAIVAALGHLSWWYPRYCGEFTESTVGTMLEYEYQTFTVGTSAKGEFLPKTVHFLPNDNTVAEALMAGESPARLRGLPANITPNILDYNPLDFRAIIHTPDNFKATYQMFYFPGWRLTVNGRPSPITVATGSGLIQFDVPAGEHEVRVFFGLTPLRAIASSITAITLLALILTLIRASTPKKNVMTRHLSGPVLLLALPLALISAKLLFIDRSNNPFNQNTLEASSLGTPLEVSLDNGLDTLAYKIVPTEVASGSSFEVELYLTPRKSIKHDYRPFFQLQDTANLIWNLNPHETVPPRWHREPPETQYWSVGHYGQFARKYQVLSGTPPGAYHLYATLFDAHTLETSKIISSDGAPLSDHVDLGQVTVVRPTIPPPVTTLEMQVETETRLTSEITLLGGSTDRQQANPGDLLTITLFFRADTVPKTDEYITLALQETDFAARLQLTPGFATSNWLKGDVWRGQHTLRLPANLPSGEYTWTVRADSTKHDISYLKKISITEHERIYEKPIITNQTQGKFGQSIVLVGYSGTLAQMETGDIFEIILVWKASSTPDEDMSAFLHLETSDGKLVAQHDGVPARWSRPTSGWIAGEYIVDPREITIPSDTKPGTYKLYAGMANRTSGHRLSVITDSEINDRLLLGQFLVTP